jgi:thioesterase domain-containing protein/acyl carrier protein
VIDTDARDFAEILVQATVRDTLRVDSVPLSRSFWDLGGTSLGLIQLQERLLEATGRELDLERLWTSPSVEDIARALRETAPGARSRRLVSVTPPGSATLFCVHAVVGMALKYRELASLLQQYGIQVRAFQARGLLPGEEPYADLRDMARGYAAEIIEAGVDEIDLLGYSLGALVAYEMTKELEARGRQVRNLFLLSTYAPTEPARSAHLNEKVPSEVVLASALGGTWDRDELMRVPATERLQWICARGSEQGLLPPGYRPEDLARLAHVVEAHAASADRYLPEPKAVNADVTVLSCPVQDVPADMWWTSTLGHEPRTTSLPGPHYLLLDGINAVELAGTVRRTMER